MRVQKPDLSATSELITATDTGGNPEDGSRHIQLKHGLSIILPAHNEAQVIAKTVGDVVTTLRQWVADFDVIVVNDGSVDQTGSILADLARKESRLHVVTHEVNQGYGAALVSGFQAVDKELAFFMDSDGQFDINDIQRFFPYVDQYDAVLGYRIDRQDTWMRSLNAWGWKMLVRMMLGVKVRDVDCAFKLYRRTFLEQNQLETRGAMINAEMLYKLKRGGYTFKEVGVQHLPRLSGKATGANPRVIIRAFKELFTYAYKWKAEEKRASAQ
jgi:glycosyltransferase involved in cell wall biosynthesis